MPPVSPWSVKGIDPRARDAARNVARREGLTLGEYLNRLILEPALGEDRPDQHGEAGRAPAREPARDMPREIARELARDAARNEFAASSRWREGGPGDPYGYDFEDSARVSRALERLSHRIEASERRSSIAIGDIEQSVSSILGRMEGGDRGAQREALRIEEQLREIRAAQDQIADRIRRAERDGSGSGPDLAGLRAMEAALSRLARQTGENEKAIESIAAEAADRQQVFHQKLNDSLAHVAGNFQQALTGIERRVADQVRDQARELGRDAEHRMAGAVEGIEESVRRIADRLNRAEGMTNQAIQALEKSFTHLDQRLIQAEKAGLSPDLSASVARKVDGLAAELGAMVEGVRNELAEELEAALHGLKSGAIEQAIEAVAGRLSRLERVQDTALRAAGEEMRNVAQSLGARLEALESRPDSGGEAIGGQIEARLNELGERLESRLTEVENRNADAIEQIGEQVAQAAERLQTRQDAATNTLAERLKDSESRAGQKLDEAFAAVQARMDEAEARTIANVSPVQRAVAALARRLESLEEFSRETGAPPAHSETASRSASSGDMMAARMPQVDLPEPPNFEESDFSEDTENDFALYSEGRGEADVPAPDHDKGDEADPLLAAFGRAGFRSGAPGPEDAVAVSPERFLDPLAAMPAKEMPAPASGSSEDFLQMARRAAREGASGKTRAEPRAATRAPREAGELGQGRRALQFVAIGVTLVAVGGVAWQQWRVRQPTVSGPKLSETKPAPAAKSGVPEAQKATTPASGGQTAIAQIPAATGATATPAGPVPAGSGPAGSDPAGSGRTSPDATVAGTPDKAAETTPAAPALAQPKTGEPTARANPVATKAAEGSVASPVGNAQPRSINGERPGTVAEAAEAGDPIAQYQFGLQKFEAGAREEAAAFIRRAAAQGLPAAQYRLAKMHERGENGTPDLTKARQLTQDAAAGGNRKAMHDIAVFFAEGEGGPQDFAQAARWFRRAAERGLPDSQYNLGVFYDQGLGVKADPEEALFWFTLAERAGDGDARKRVGELKASLAPERAQSVRTRVAGFTPRLIDPAAQGEFGSRSWISNTPDNAAKSEKGGKAEKTGKPEKGGTAAKAAR